MVLPREEEVINEGILFHVMARPEYSDLMTRYGI